MQLKDVFKFCVSSHFYHLRSMRTFPQYISRVAKWWIGTDVHGCE